MHADYALDEKGISQKFYNKFKISNISDVLTTLPGYYFRKSDLSVNDIFTGHGHSTDVLLKCLDLYSYYRNFLLCTGRENFLCCLSGTTFSIKKMYGEWTVRETRIVLANCVLKVPELLYFKYFLSPETSFELSSFSSFINFNFLIPLLTFANRFWNYWRFNLSKKTVSW